MAGALRAAASSDMPIESPASPPAMAISEAAKSAVPAYAADLPKVKEHPASLGTPEIKLKHDDKYKSINLAPLPAVNDLFSAHNFDLNIDINVVPNGILNF